MKLFRPAHVRFEYRESPDDRLRALMSGDANAPAGTWLATAAHLDGEVEVIAADLALYAAIPEQGIDAGTFPGDPDAVARLVACGLILSDGPADRIHAARDAALRAAGWWGPAALVQRLSRWDGVDVAAMEAQDGKRGIARLLQEQGPPPTESFRIRDAAEAIPLPVPTPEALDALLAARTTCRNFDAATLPIGHLSRVLHRAFGAQDRQELAPGAVMLKKNSPSGGGLHPVEAYVLAQRVDGLATGLYHYQCLDHALEPMHRLDATGASKLAHELVAGQSWFANAPVLVLMAARFDRSFWKYPDHAKAWKVIQLDAGHLSQNFYLSATDLGYGAFITAAINDACAERAFGLDGTTSGAVAVCGFGKRAPQGGNVEFDPLGKAVR
jgi:putative peptide maturation dehydrogenase